MKERNRFFSPEPSAKSLSMIGFEGHSNDLGVKFSFCSKVQDPSSEYFSPQWPPGRYCILRKSTDPGKGKCPPSKCILARLFVIVVVLSFLLIVLVLRVICNRGQLTCRRFSALPAESLTMYVLRALYFI